MPFKTLFEPKKVHPRHRRIIRHDAGPSARSPRFSCKCRRHRNQPSGLASTSGNSRSGSVRAPAWVPLHQASCQRHLLGPLVLRSAHPSPPRPSRPARSPSPGAVGVTPEDRGPLASLLSPSIKSTTSVPFLPCCPLPCCDSCSVDELWKTPGVPSTCPSPVGASSVDLGGASRTPSPYPAWPQWPRTCPRHPPTIQLQATQ